MTRRGAARQGGGITHWVAGGCCAVALHAALIVAVLAKWETQPDAVAAAPAIMLDLSPPPAAPQEPQTEVPPGPQQAEAEPPPAEPLQEAKVDPEPEPPPPDPVQEARIEPVPEAPPPPPEAVVIPDPPKLEREPPAEVALPAPPPPPPPKPKVEPPKVQPKVRPKVERMPDKPKRERVAKLTTAPPPSERRAARQSAPIHGNLPPVNPNAVPNWKALVAARLQGSKRYPDAARSRGEQGVATLAFSIDRSGRAIGGRIARSSGSSVLDQETLALLHRASPFPPPPPEVRGGAIAIVVPIRYNIR